MTADQSRPVSRAFMSRLREVLTARLPQGPGWVVWVDGVVEELAAGCGVEDPRLAQIRAQADKVADTKYPYVTAVWLRTVLDAVSVDATPAPGIDRDALERLIIEARYSRGNRWTTEKFADAIEALVRPVEGVVLSRDDALAIATALNGGTWVTDSDAAAARRAAMVDRLRAEARR